MQILFIFKQIAFLRAFTMVLNIKKAINSRKFMCKTEIYEQHKYGIFYEIKCYYSKMLFFFFFFCIIAKKSVKIKLVIKKNGAYFLKIK